MQAKRQVLFTPNDNKTSRTPVHLLWPLHIARTVFNVPLRWFALKKVYSILFPLEIDKTVSSAKKVDLHAEDFGIWSFPIRLGSLFYSCYKFIVRSICGVITLPHYFPISKAQYDLVDCSHREVRTHLLQAQCCVALNQS